MDSASGASRLAARANPRIFPKRNPKDTRDSALQQKVLAHLQAAERGLGRVEAARNRVGLAAFAVVLGSLRISSLGSSGQSQDPAGDRCRARSGTAPTRE